MKVGPPSFLSRFMRKRVGLLAQVSKSPALRRSCSRIGSSFKNAEGRGTRRTSFPEFRFFRASVVK
jgi:hypothetical protein